MTTKLTDATTEQDAREVIATVARNQKRWEAWFPNADSGVYVSRRQLLALIYFAEIGLRTACDNKEPKQ